MYKLIIVIGLPLTIILGYMYTCISVYLNVCWYEYIYILDFKQFLCCGSLFPVSYSILMLIISEIYFKYKA